MSWVTFNFVITEPVLLETSQTVSLYLQRAHTTRDWIRDSRQPLSLAMIIPPPDECGNIGFFFLSFPFSPPPFHSLYVLKLCSFFFLSVVWWRPLVVLDVPLDAVLAHCKLCKYLIYFLFLMGRFKTSGKKKAGWLWETSEMWDSVSTGKCLDFFFFMKYIFYWIFLWTLAPAFV